MVKYKSDGRYHLTINNIAVRSVTLICPTRTDVQVGASWLCDLSIVR